MVVEVSVALVALGLIGGFAKWFHDRVAAIAEAVRADNERTRSAAQQVANDLALLGFELTHVREALDHLQIELATLQTAVRALELWRERREGRDEGASR